MAPRRRTLLFVFTSILLSLNDDFVASLPVGPVVTEYYPYPGSPPQLTNSLLTVTTGNRVLPEYPQKAYPPQLFNEVFSFGPHPPGLSINTVATTNYGVPKPNSFPTYATYAPVETSIPPAEIESVTIIENYPPVRQIIQVEGFAPTANVSEIKQTPITVQIPSMPQLSPFVSVASPLPVENTTLSQQLPVALQINMASPSFPEPMLAYISQPAAASPYSSFNPSLDMPPAPIIVMEKSKSKLKSILPILMLSLFDGGCGNSGGGGCPCSQCSAPTPVPFPIAIPTNSPFINRGRSKGKGKASTNTQS